LLQQRSSSRHEEIKEKARLLLEKAQRESFDVKNVQPAPQLTAVDEDNHQHQQPMTRHQLQSVDNNATTAESAVCTGELRFLRSFNGTLF